MPLKRKPEGTAMSHWPEWYIASHRVNRYSLIITAAGLDRQELRRDLMVFLFEKGNLFDPSRSQRGTFLFFIAERYIFRRIASANIRRRRMAKYRIERRTIPPFRPSEEVAEHVRMLMQRLPSRRRQMVTHFAAGWTLEKMSRRHGVTRERCRQILMRGIEEMRNRAMEIAHNAGVSADEYWSDLL